MSDIEKTVQDHYNAYPLPDLSDPERAKKMFDDFLNELKEMGISTSWLQDKKILVIFAGTGPQVIPVSWYAHEVVAIDLAERSLEELEKNLRKYGNNLSIVRIIKTSIYELDLKGESFDLILAPGGLHHTQNPTEAFYKISKLLKKDGYIFFSVYNKTGLLFYRLKVRMLDMLFGKSTLHNTTKRINFARKIYRDKRDTISLVDAWANVHIRYVDLHEILQWLSNTGMKIIDIRAPVNFHDFLIQLYENGTSSTYFRLLEYFINGMVRILKPYIRKNVTKWKREHISNAVHDMNYSEIKFTEFLWLLSGRGNIHYLAQKKITESE